MTVVAWDGKTLAADKRANAQGGIFTVTKIRKINGNLVGSCDTLGSCVALLNWFENGAKANEWPEFQKDNDLWSPLLVITPEKKILRYDRQPYPYEIEQHFYAMGSGRDYAMGAMEAGASAIQAVRIASVWDMSCGNGIDSLEFD